MNRNLLETPVQFTDEWYKTNEAQMMREVTKLRILLVKAHALIVDMDKGSNNSPAITQRIEEFRNEVLERLMLGLASTRAATEGLCAT